MCVSFAGAGVRGLEREARASALSWAWSLMGVGLSTGGGGFEVVALVDGLPGLGVEAHPGSQGLPIRNPYREVVSIAFSPAGLYDVGRGRVCDWGAEAFE